jgi:hypothetical protein
LEVAVELAEELEVVQVVAEEWEGELEVVQVVA